MSLILRFTNSPILIPDEISKFNIAIFLEFPDNSVLNNSNSSSVNTLFTTTGVLTLLESCFHKKDTIQNMRHARLTECILPVEIIMMVILMILADGRAMNGMTTLKKYLILQSEM